ncbi:MAG: aspartate:alanine exchanger family transporter [Ancrocorticia sp.]|uniref:aspartate:alanine exchanger family transporter n=1 Tax=Ancrocorticia sp. TaxID=2593684 RepID=UPI003F8F5A29
MAPVFNYLVEEPVFFTFLIVGVGMALGALKIKGIGFGAAMVLFVAIIFSAWGGAAGYEIRVPAELGTFGLVLFAFSIGNNAGANFFSSLRQGAGPILMMVVLFMLTGATAYLLGAKVLGMDTTVVAGTFAGALTNTPTLATVGEASGDIGGATVGYALAYLFGVVGMLIAASFALRQAPHDKDAPEPVTHMTLRVERTDLPRLRDVASHIDGPVEFSRLRRGEQGPIWLPTLSDVLHQDDLLTVVGPTSHFASVEREIGHRSSHSLRADRRLMDFRRVTISNHKLAGMTVRQVDEELEKHWNARLSRVRRGDDDRLATPDLMLELGDRVRVVAPTQEMSKISKWMGDSAKGLTDINPIALGLGLALGIFIGELPIPLPGGASFSIGAAAGVLIIGLIMGRVGRIGPLVTALPNTANLVIGELGLLIFLAQAGSNAGGQILGAFSSGEWWKILLLGIALTSIMAFGLYVVMRRMFTMGGTKLSGLIAGAQTQPAILAFANGQTNNDPRVAMGYALVYPVAMIGKIIVGYILATM